LTTEYTVKNIPDWFPGAGFKQFAKAGRGLFDIAVDGPLDYVKETLKVRLPAAQAYTSLSDRKANGSNVSIAASCFGRVEELAGRGLDEGVIRAVTATMYIGKTNRPNRTRRYSFAIPQPRRIP
jgi:hypothetical protein